MPDQLWDTHTPQNTYDLEVSLLGDGGKVLDTRWAVHFGFREFWIDGRDFFLNGGGQAVIVRVHKASSGQSKPASCKLDTLTLEAATPGACGVGPQVRILPLLAGR